MLIWPGNNLLFLINGTIFDISFLLMVDFGVWWKFTGAWHQLCWVNALSRIQRDGILWTQHCNEGEKVSIPLQQFWTILLSTENAIKAYATQMHEYALPFLERELHLLKCICEHIYIDFIFCLTYALIYEVASQKQIVFYFSWFALKCWLCFGTNSLIEAILHIPP